MIKLIEIPTVMAASSISKMLIAATYFCFVYGCHLQKFMPYWLSILIYTWLSRAQNHWLCLGFQHNEKSMLHIYVSKMVPWYLKLSPIPMDWTNSGIPFYLCLLCSSKANHSSCKTILLLQPTDINKIRVPKCTKRFKTLAWRI